MKNIFKIFKNDATKIITNVVAVVVVLGLCVLPSLYAWFNIFSNWNPYGKEATGNLKVAVYSEDLGGNVGSLKINVGDSLIEGLKANDTIGWVFTESIDETLLGVNSGEFYAALVVPQSFSSDLLSFLSGEVKHPEIIYYVNEKKNAIAPKITDKAQKAVQQQINTSFISKLAGALLESGNVVYESENGEVSAVAALNRRLTKLNKELSGYVSVLESFKTIIQASKNVIDATEKMLPGVEGMSESAKSSIEALESSIEASKVTVKTLTKMFEASLDVIGNSMSSAEKLINTTLDVAERTSTDLVAKLDTVKALMPYVEELYKLTANDVAANADSKTKAEIEKIGKQLSVVTADVDALTKAVNDETKNVSELRKKVTEDINVCKKSVDDLKKSFSKDLKPALEDTFVKADGAMKEVMKILKNIDIDFQGVTGVLNQYDKTLSAGDKSLDSTLEIAKGLSAKVERISNNLMNLEANEKYESVLNFLKNDSKKTTDFITSPVKLETKEIYQIENYGSAMSPFYTILAIWVGALILVAIIHVHVKPVNGIEEIKPYQAYFGRYIIFFMIGQIQTLITVLGNLCFIEIQCRNPFLFWLACSVCSFVFTLFIYSLTVAFGNVGEAIAVIVMVIQVAGAGCTFPIETLPTVFQKIYAYLPFQFGMNAMKETVGGMYENDYWIFILKLLAYVVLSLIIGLALTKPCAKLNKLVEKSKKKSGIMI